MGGAAGGFGGHFSSGGAGPIGTRHGYALDWNDKMKSELEKELIERGLKPSVPLADLPQPIVFPHPQPKQRDNAWPAVVFAIAVILVGC